MNHFHYHQGELYAEDLPLEQIAAAVGTPFYCYSTATLQRHFIAFQEAMTGLRATICFAVKANGNIAVIRTLAELGAGADVVSEGELRRALAAGVPAGRIVFSGVGKARPEIELAINSGILQINAESEPELDLLSQVAVQLGKKIAIGIRVNPDVDAATHAKITTGRKENKFGIEWTHAHRILQHANRLPGLDVAAVAVHIGSQLTDLAPFREAFLRVRDLVVMLRADGIAIRRIDLGGGLGIPYDPQMAPPPSPAAYGALVRQILGDLECDLICEPGRLLVGNAGMLISRVLYIKEGATRSFVICDAAMNDLVRPAMYDAHHEIIPVRQPESGVAMGVMDVVGPVCESGDTFARQRTLPPLASGDLLAFASAGAYGATMSSTYNARRLVPEVLVKGTAFAVVRRRPSYDEMLSLETFPEWMK